MAAVFGGDRGEDDQWMPGAVDPALHPRHYHPYHHRHHRLVGVGRTSPDYLDRSRIPLNSILREEKTGGFHLVWMKTTGCFIEREAFFSLVKPIKLIFIAPSCCTSLTAVIGLLESG